MSIYHKIYPKDYFQKSLAAIKKCLIFVITRVGESNLYSFEGINGRGTPCKLSGFQEVNIFTEVKLNSFRFTESPSRNGKIRLQMLRKTTGSMKILNIL